MLIFANIDKMSVKLKSVYFLKSKAVRITIKNGTPVAPKELSFWFIGRGYTLSVFSIQHSTCLLYFISFLIRIAMKLPWIISEVMKVNFLNMISLKSVDKESQDNFDFTKIFLAMNSYFSNISLKPAFWNLIRQINEILNQWNFLLF